MGHHHHGGGPLLYGIRKARREEGRALARQAARNRTWQPPAPPAAPKPPKVSTGYELLAPLLFIAFIVILVALSS